MVDGQHAELPSGESVTSTIPAKSATASHGKEHGREDANCWVYIRASRECKAEFLGVVKIMIFFGYPE